MTMQGKHILSFIKKFRPSLRHGLFLFMLLSFIILGLRVHEIVVELAEGRTPPAVKPAHAEEAKHEEAAKAAEPAKAEEKAPDTKAAEGKSADVKPADAKPAEPPKEGGTAEKAGEKPAEKKEGAAEAPQVETPRFTEPENYTEAEVNILKSLSVRRQELEKRNSEMDQREALLKVTEQRVDRKITELRAMQEQVRQAIGAANAEQKARTSSLVKIYETMKPKDAARIFENMDTLALLDVVRQMKEARTAPILAAMDPRKAKELTSALMERKPLPAMP